MYSIQRALSLQVLLTFQYLLFFVSVELAEISLKFVVFEEYAYNLKVLQRLAEISSRGLDIGKQDLIYDDWIQVTFGTQWFCTQAVLSCLDRSR